MLRKLGACIALLLSWTSVAAAQEKPQPPPRPSAPTPMEPVGAATAVLPFTPRVAGFDVVTSIASLPLGSELLTGEVDARVAIARSFGRLSLSLAAAVGQGVDVRNDVDGEASALAAVRVAQRLWVGAECRARGELVDRFQTAEDVGRPIEIAGGGAAGVTLGRVDLRGIAGWLSPRGLFPAGPAALTSATLSF